MVKPFNSTFFATVAVVLPVLFLALALQTDYLARTVLASFLVNARRLDSQANAQQSPLVVLGTLVNFLLAFVIFLVVIIVMFIGLWGEFLALYALEQQQALLSTQSAVMWSAGVLIVVATIASVWRVLDFLIQDGKERRHEALANGASPPDLETKSAAS
jgi:flagellar biosynthesis protein FlhB